MNPYPTYRQSSLSWLSDIPSHWEVNLIKRGFEVTLGKMLQPEQKRESEFLAPYLRSANVQWGKVDISDIQQMWFDTNEAQQLGLEYNDLVMCEGGDAGRAAIWKSETTGCFFQNSVNRVRSAGGNNTSYLMYWMSLIKSGGFVDIICNKATIAHLTKEKLMNLPMLYPPMDEQIAIATYLDAETARIDELISEKEKLKNLLKNLRQTVISETVQNGLVFNQSMKLSGIDWLGKIPSNWRIAKLKHVCSRITDGAHVSPDLAAPDFPFVSTVDIKNDQIDFNGCLKTTAHSFSMMKRNDCCPKRGDVLYSKDGTIGRTCYVNFQEDFAVASSLIILRPESEVVDGEFLCYWLNHSGLKQNVELQLAGAALRRISIEKVTRFPIAVPPLAEQKEIVAKIKIDLEKTDKLFDHVCNEIEILKELRSATITDAVVGRIDVRGPLKN